MARTAKSRSRQPTDMDESRRVRREIIITAAAKLFAELGYSAATMDELAVLTKMNKGTIYYYYKSKADILFDMISGTAEYSIKLMTPAEKMGRASDALTHLVEVIIRWVIEHPETVQVYFQEGPYFKRIFDKAQFAAVSAQQREVSKLCYRVLNRGIASKEFGECDVTTTGRLIIGMVMGVHRWPDAKTNSDRLAAQAVHLILNGLKSGKK